MERLVQPLVCCFCRKQINNFMDSHNPEPLEKSPKRCCNVCNEKVVLERLKELRK